MAGERGTLEVLATSVAGLLQPLEERLAAGELRLLIAELGLQLPASVEANANLANAVRTALQRLRDLPTLLAQLAAAIEAENTGQILSKGLEVANAVKSVIEAVEAVGNAIKALAVAGIPAAELNAFANELPRRLVDYLGVRNLEAIPGIVESLEFIGAAERTLVPGVDAAHPAFIRRSLDLGALTDFIGDPLGKLGTLYQWGSPAFNAGLSTAVELVAVDGRAYSVERLQQAITAAKGGTAPIQLLVKDGEVYKTVGIAYAGGLRHPKLERIDGVDDRLTPLLTARP